jgi:hypothetical protein
MTESPDSPEILALADAGKRVHDTVALHIVGGNVGKWVAVRLADGSSDGIPYDSRSDAIAHQLHEQLCCYLKVTPDGITPQDAVRFILVNRALYDAGYRLADPDMPGEPIYPQTREEEIAWILGLGERANE